MSTWRFVFLIVFSLLAIEGLLALRVWMQATAQPIDSDGAQGLFDITDTLAAPLFIVTGEKPLRESGVVDFTVLASIEFYVVVALILIACVVLVNGGWNRLMALRPAHHPDFVLQQMKDKPIRRVWQPVAATHVRPGRLYVSHLSNGRKARVSPK